MIAELLVCCSLLAPALARPAGPEAGDQDTANSYYYFLTGRRLESLGDVPGAIKSFEQAAKLDPKSAEVRAELASLYARQGRPTEAVEWANAAIALDSQNAEANRVLGMIYSERVRLDEEARPGDAAAAENAKKAIQHLEIARRHATILDPRLAMLLGRLYMRTGASDDAISILRRLAEQEPERPEPILLLAQAYERAGRLADARTLLETSVGQHPEFYGTLGGMYEAERRWSDAADAYERALSRNPRSLELKTRLAAALLSEGGSAEAGKAATLLQQARTQSPADPEVLYLLSQAQRMAGNLDEAEATAKALKAVAPSSLRGSYALAQVYREKQEYRQVVDVLEPAVSKTTGPSRQPEELPALLTLALGYQELGQFDRSLATFEQARAVAPTNPNVDVYVLAALVAGKRYREALDRSQALLEARPNDQRIVRLRADALHGVGRTDEGLALLRRAVETHGDDVATYLALSELHVSAGQYDAAVKVLAEAGRKFPSDPTVGFQLGSVYEREKRYAEAERAFRDVIAKDPLFAPALNYLGYMLADRGIRLDESIGYIKRALKVEPHNGAYLDSLGWAYFKANRLDLAEESLRKAAAQRVRDSAVQDHYGDLLFRLGRYQQAIDAWRQALDGDGEQIDRAGIDRKIRTATERAAKQ